MHWIALVRRVRALVARRAVEREMCEELQLHFELQRRDLERSGLAVDAAHRATVHRFGGMEVVKESHRDARGVRPLEDFMQDIRVGLRTLLNQPGFTIVAVMTLALGIGATTAIFSVVDGVLLRPLPYPAPGQVVVVHERQGDGQDNRIAAANFLDWRQRSRSFTGIALYQDAIITVLGGDEPVRRQGAGVTQDFFSVFGLQPVLGRTFTPDEMRHGGHAAVVVSYDFWQSQLGSDPNPATRKLRILGTSYTVVGVMPAGFHFPGNCDLWIPADPAGAADESRTAHNWAAAVGRLRDGVDVARARSELSHIQAGIKAQYGSSVDAVGANVRTLRDELVGSMTRPLLLLLGAAALVLLIACTNLGGTLLARGAARQRELAVRAALGAGRQRLVRQLFTESLLLASLGVLAGLVVAEVFVRAIVALAPASLPRVNEIRIDGSVLAFAVILSLVTAMVFGLLPALRLAMSAPARVLTSGSRGTASGGRGIRWSVLVASEVALALVLLVGAGLLIRSFQRLLSVDPGYDSAGILTLDLALPESEYPDDGAVRVFYRELLAEIGSIPGVRNVGVINVLPIEPSFRNGDFQIDGRGPGSGYGEYRAVGGDYFRALGIPLLRGRLFDSDDDAGRPDVAIVNQALADRYWPDENAVGKRIRNLGNDAARYGGERWITVVGVVASVRQGALNGGFSPTVFVDAAQRPFRARYASIVIRAAMPTASLVGAVQSRLHHLGPDVPVEFSTMDARIGETVAGRRFVISVLGFFAEVALLLAGVGIYGVVSYQVAQRTREIGVRLALGAGPGRVLREVIAHGMLPLGVGLVAGVLAAFALTHVLSSLLYEVGPGDPITFASVIVLLAIVALLAILIPARRATRIDPLVAMQAE